MTPRERIFAALSGRRPDLVPFTLCGRMTQEPEAMALLARQGFGVTRHVSTVRTHTPNVQYASETFSHDGRRWHRHTIRTPVGEVSRLSRDGRGREHYIRRPEDYRVIEFVAHDTRFEPSFDTFLALEKELGERGATLVSAGRSPLQSILVDYAGPELLHRHLAEGRPELLSLYHTLVETQRVMWRLIAQGPGEVVKLWEHLNDEAVDSTRFAQFHLPVYQEVCELLRAGGKRLIAHTNRGISRLKEGLAASPVGGIESLTPPPEGDVPLSLARRLFPGKSLWVNTPVSRYHDTPESLVAYLRGVLEQTRPWAGILFEISDGLPANWQERAPLVLRLLEETRQ